MDFWKRQVSSSSSFFDKTLTARFGSCWIATCQAQTIRLVSNRLSNSPRMLKIPKICQTCEEKRLITERHACDRIPFSSDTGANKKRFPDT